MRRLAPLLALIALGCGGSGGGSNPQTFLSLRMGAGETYAYGTDGAGSPLLAVAHVAKKTVEVRSTEGTATYPLPGTRLFAMTVTGGYLLLTVDDDGTDGTVVVDRQTRASTFHAGEYVRAHDGDRVVWGTNEGGYSLQTLPDGPHTALSVPDDETLEDLRGDRLVLRRRGQNYGDFSDPDRFRTVDLAGTEIATLAVPDGAFTLTNAFVNASGAAAGSASTTSDFFTEYEENRPYVWSPEGIPTTVPGAGRGVVVGFGDDGTVLLQDLASGRLRLYREGTPLPFLSPVGAEGALSRDGRIVFTWNPSGTLVQAVGVRP